MDWQPAPQGKATAQRNICPQAPEAHKCQRKLKVPSSCVSSEKVRGPLALKGTGVSMPDEGCLTDQKPDLGELGRGFMETSFLGIQKEHSGVHYEKSRHRLAGKMLEISCSVFFGHHVAPTHSLQPSGTPHCRNVFLLCL